MVPPLMHCPRFKPRLFLIAGVVLVLDLLPAAADADRRDVLSADAPIEIRSGSLIVAEGDSLTYGQDLTDDGAHKPAINGAPSERSRSPYPETLEADLHHDVRVENRGYPGDRTTEGLLRWENAISGQVALLMYGTNDGGNYGNFPEGPVSLERYKKQLTELVRRRQNGGAVVVILDLPPVAVAEQNLKLEAYRKAAAEVAAATGARFFATGRALAGVPRKWVDGLHLTADAYQAIARQLAASIQLK